MQLIREAWRGDDAAAEGPYDVNLDRCQQLVRELEPKPHCVPAFYSELEAAILWLMDTTPKLAENDDRSRHAAVEMRLRLTLDRYRRRGRIERLRSADCGATRERWSGAA